MAALAPEKESPYSKEEEDDRAAAASRADALAEQARSEMMEASVASGGGSGKPARRQSALAGMGVFEGVSAQLLSYLSRERLTFFLKLIFTIPFEIIAQSRANPRRR
jgi:hypothetical protein